MKSDLPPHHFPTNSHLAHDQLSAASPVPISVLLALLAISPDPLLSSTQSHKSSSPVHPYSKISFW